MAVELMTVTAYARHRGCDEKAVRKAIDEGRITALMVDGKRRIDPDVADIQWAKNTRARADSSGKPAAQSSASPATGAALAGPSGPDVGAAPDYHQTRAQREHVELQRARIMLAEEERRLIELEPATTAVFTAFRGLRDTAMPVGRRLAARLATMTDPLEIQLLIDESMREVLRNFHDRTLAALANKLAGTQVDLSKLSQAEASDVAA